MPMESLSLPKTSGVCDNCKGILRPFVSGSYPPASEMYCDPCHKSYSMTQAEFKSAMARMAPRPVAN